MRTTVIMSIEVLKDLGIMNGKIRVLDWFMDHIGKISAAKPCIVIAHVDDISRDLGSPVVSVRRWLSFLIDKGYISRHRLSNGRIVNNVYVVNNKYIAKNKLVYKEPDPDEEAIP